MSADPDAAQPPREGYADEGPRAFYTERLPAHFNRAFQESRARGEDDSVYRALATVDATLTVEVEDAGAEAGPWILNIERGVMRAGDAPAHPPFLRLRHDLAAFAVLMRESRRAGGSALGFLGSVIGLGGELRLTRRRVDELRAIDGCVRFTLSGPGGFTVVSQFGNAAIPAEPHCALRMDTEVWEQLRAQEIDPTEAFMSGQIDVEGDMQRAIQLAMAVMSED